MMKDILTTLTGYTFEMDNNSHTYFANVLGHYVRYNSYRNSFWSRSLPEVTEIEQKGLEAMWKDVLHYVEQKNQFYRDVEAKLHATTGQVFVIDSRGLFAKGANRWESKHATILFEYGKFLFFHYLLGKRIEVFTVDDLCREIKIRFAQIVHVREQQIAEAKRWLNEGENG